MIYSALTRGSSDGTRQYAKFSQSCLLAMLTIFFCFAAFVRYNTQLVIGLIISNKLIAFADLRQCFVLLWCFAVTGLNKWIAVFSVGVVCTFYTTVVSVLRTSIFVSR